MVQKKIILTRSQKAELKKRIEDKKKVRRILSVINHKRLKPKTKLYLIQAMNL